MDRSLQKAAHSSASNFPKSQDVQKNSGFLQVNGDVGDYDPTTPDFADFGLGGLVANTNFDNLLFGNDTKGNFQFTAGQITTVPEPNSLLLIGSLCIVSGGCARAAADKSESRPWALCRRRRLSSYTCNLANPARASRWFRLDPKELSLPKYLNQLPGNDEDTQPVIIDLNGHVAIIGRSNTADQATVCLELDRSLHIGPDYRVAISRQDVAQAVKLEIDSLFIFGKGVPDRAE